MNPVLKFRKLHPEVPTPVYGTQSAACFDLAYFAMHTKKIIQYKNTEKHELEINNSEKKILLCNGSTYLIPTGLVFDIPEGYSLRIHARSSLPLKIGLFIANGQGIVDSDYTDETFILVKAINSYSELKHLTRLAQAELVPVLRPHLVESFVDVAQKGNRFGGFGSTGT